MFFASVFAFTRSWKRFSPSPRESRSGGVTDPQADTISIQESDRLGVHIAGSGCAIPLSTEGNLCRVLPARCDVTTTDSGRLAVDVFDGDGFLDGDRLTLTIEARADFLDAGFSCDLVSTYELERVGRD